MSLLQNEEFVLYQLRTAYLSCIKDGVGERLINVNTSVLNNPAFRAAGWVPNAADIKRTYSPPIPTAVAAEYFQVPKSAGLHGPSFADEDEEGGMVTGGAGSNDTVGPTLNTRRRRRREQHEEDDSSDLSDESDDEEEAANRAAQQIKFNKMPVRTRAGSSPLRSTTLQEGPSLLVTSPSRPPSNGDRLRRGSLGAVEAVKARARRDTTTSSEMSSENELDPSVFQRKTISSRRGTTASQVPWRIQEDDREGEPQTPLHDPGAESDSSLSSGFSETADSASLLGGVANPSTPMESRLRLPQMPPAITPHGISPKKGRQALPILDTLPASRPISMVQPVSALTQALKAKDKKPTNPLEKYTGFSGKGEPNPLYIKFYAPFSEDESKPYEVLLRRAGTGGNITTVADAIGFGLWRYGEEKREPPLKPEQKNVNRWVMRMVEDEEVDYDFPALTRTKPIGDFTSNNNRARPRAREKPWDEFALVEAKEAEYQENEKLTPDYGVDASEDTLGVETPSELLTPTQERQQSQSQPSILPTPTPTPATIRNPVLGPSFGPPTALRKESINPLDTPIAPTSHATPRTGAPKTLTVHFTDDNFLTRSITIEVTTDTYLAEVFDQSCKKLSVDPSLYVLKVTNTSTVAPSDRTVEALGDRSDLDLVRRRFVGDGSFGLSGSPGSSSPNAPLLIAPGGTPKKGKKSGLGVMHPLTQKADAFATANTTTYKRYAVLRKQPMSFASSSSRILALDGEYMHIMPAEKANNPAGAFFDQGKTTTVHFSSVVGSKVSRRHPKMFRVVVYKERETKRYDFEASSAEEASEIVREVRRGLERFQAGDG